MCCTAAGFVLIELGCCQRLRLAAHLSGQDKGRREPAQVSIDGGDVGILCIPT